MLRIGCPSCGTVYNLEDSFYEKSVVCQRCTSRFLVTDQVMKPVAEPQELQFETEAPVEQPEPHLQPMPRYPRPSRGTAHSARRSIVVPALIMGVTVLIVGAIVVGSILYLIHGLNEDENKPRKVAVGTRPTRAGGGAANLAIPEVDPNLKANFTIADIDGSATGLTVLRPDAPHWPIVERPPSGKDEAGAVATVKKGAVLIKVEREDGAGSGSGFFALEPGLVVTNAHVVGMMKPSDPPPDALEVCVNSGETNEARLKATVVAVDRRHDLALLRVRGNNLPQPLQIVSSTGLSEAQEVFIAGWPYASQIGANVSISKSSISSLRKENGVLRHIQTLGGMNPGNSGGPVVDGLGRVVGIAVSVLRGTDINFAVPTDYIADLYRGRMQQMLVFPAAANGKELLLPMSLFFDDAMGRIGKVRVEFWSGKPGPSRPASNGEGPKQPGDADRQRLEFTYSKSKGQGEANGELRLPLLAEGEVYWLQVVTTDSKDQTERWYAPQPWKPQALLERRSVRWNAPAPTAEKLDMIYRSTNRIRGDRSEFPFSPIRLFLRNDWEETTEPSGIARKATQIKVGARASEQVLALQQVLGMGMGAISFQPARGRREPDETKLSPVDQFLFMQWGPYLQSLADATRVPPTPGTIEPMKTRWNAEGHLSVPYLFGRLEIPKLPMRYQLLGLQKVDGKELALVRLESRIAPSDESQVLGHLCGLARVDLATGKTMNVYGFFEFEAENVPMPPIQAQMESLGEAAFLHGTTDFRWSAKPVPPASKASE